MNVYKKSHRDTAADVIFGVLLGLLIFAALCATRTEYGNTHPEVCAESEWAK
jgi:hypothetical protein